MTNPLTVPIGELSVAEQIVGNLYHMVLTNPASLSEMVGHADRIYSDVRGEGKMSGSCSVDVD